MKFNNINNTFKTSLFVALVLLTSSCTKWNCVGGSGPVVKIATPVSPFEGISYSGSADIKIIHSTENKVEIEAEQSIAEAYRYHVFNGVLFFDAPNCTRTHTSPIFYVYTSEMRSINLSGSGDIITSDTFQTNVLSVRISGSGNIGLFPIQADEADINISGSGTVEVSAKNELDVNISGSGDVLYKGHPSIDTDISGSGRLINKN